MLRVIYSLDLQFNIGLTHKLTRFKLKKIFIKEI